MILANNCSKICRDNVTNNIGADDNSYTLPYYINIVTLKNDLYVTDTSEPGATVKIFKDMGSTGFLQQWQIIRVESLNPFTTYIIKNRGTNNVMTLGEISTNKNVEIKTAPFVGNIDQLWYISTVASDTGNLYYFLSVCNGLCVTIKGNDFTEGNVLITYPYEGSQSNYNYKVNKLSME